MGKAETSLHKLVLTRAGVIFVEEVLALNVVGEK